MLEFAARLAVRRADRNDMERLTDITGLLVVAFDGSDPQVLGPGFQRWLEALIDAAHSTAIRWVANPFLEAYRELLNRFPGLWVLEPTFPEHLRNFLRAVENGDEEEAIQVLRAYYHRVDGAFTQALRGVLGPNSKTDGATEAAPNSRTEGGSGNDSGNGAPIP